jgi:hypothetical protein
VPGGAPFATASEKTTTSKRSGAKVTAKQSKNAAGAHARTHRRVKYISEYIYQKGENKVKQ